MHPTCMATFLYITSWQKLRHVLQRICHRCPVHRVFHDSSQLSFIERKVARVIEPTGGSPIRNGYEPADFPLPDKDVNIRATFNEKFTPGIMLGDVGDKCIPFFSPLAVPLMMADEASHATSPSATRFTMRSSMMRLPF